MIILCLLAKTEAKQIQNWTIKQLHFRKVNPQDIIEDVFDVATLLEMEEAETKSEPSIYLQKVKQLLDITTERG